LVEKIDEKFKGLKKMKPKIGFGLSVYLQRGISLSKEKV